MARNTASYTIALCGVSAIKSPPPWGRIPPASVRGARAHRNLHAIGCAIHECGARDAYGGGGAHGPLAALRVNPEGG